MSDRGTPGKGSSSEAEYMIREDAEKLRRIALQAKREKEAAELKALKDAHFMHCPKCGLQMHELKLRGVDVDVCFSCNGIFLDQRDLEHLEKHEPKGVMSAILNWFKPETKSPV